MKLGPLPMYVIAPISTEPHETAASRCCPVGCAASAPRSFAELTPAPATPAARDANVRYVGALSSTLDSAPAAQKNCDGRAMPRLAPRSWRNDRSEERRGGEE